MGRRELQYEPSIHTGPKRWRGTTNGYRYYACRCQECREAQRLSCQDFRAQARQREPYRHDLGAYLNYGCRCEICTAANTAHSAAIRARRAAS